jgi:glycosyltransferase involved in cell wall biosynthesis
MVIFYYWVIRQKFIRQFMAKISIFLKDFDGGGAEKVMLHLANGFAKQGEDVSLVFVQPIGPYMTYINPTVRVVDLNRRTLLESLPVLIQYLKQEKPDVLLSALEDTNIIAICAAKLASINTNIIVTIHNHLSSEAQYATRLRRKVVPYLLRWFYRGADHIVAVSKGVAVDAAKWITLPKKQIKVIYNPIVIPSLAEKQNGQILHPWLNQRDIPIVLGIGRLDHQKDFATLIQAFWEVRQQRRSKLIILGEGRERANLESLIKDLALEDDIQLLGFVDNPHDYMAKVTLFVLSSAWEGFGNVLVEAMAEGTPVIATDCKSGPAEILEYGTFGQLVPVGDVKAMAMAILHTIDYPLDSATLKERSRAFSVEKALIEYRQLFS